MITLRRSIAAAFALVVLATPGPADAHQSPAGCTTSGVNVQFGGDINTVHRNGDVISVIPRVSNNAANVCDVTDATITIRFPKADGSPNGSSEVVATGLDLPAGTAPITLPAAHHTVNFNDGVFRGPVEARINGTFHWVGTHTPGAFIVGLETPLVTTKPHATIAVTPTPAVGDAPLGVTYKYEVTNDSPHDPEPGAVDPNIYEPVLTDDRCSPIPATHTGDTNMNNVMERGETWVYTCMTTLPSGTFTNHVSLSAQSTRDGLPWPATTGQSTVTVNGPDMTITKSHTGDFARGATGRTYSLVARNSGNRTATGNVSVADTLPQGLTATAISGNGWDCTIGTLTCTRSDTLAAGESYPPITVTVDVASDAPASVTNTATVTRAGENTENDGASDPTTIVAPAQETPADPTPGDTGGDSGGQTGGDAGGATGGDAGGQIGDGTTDQESRDDTVRDLTAPAFASLRLTNRTLVPRARRGTKFAYTLSEAARVGITIERRTVDRRSRVRYVRVGTLAQRGAAGRNAKAWFGRVGSKVLAPGSYRASVVATDAAGNKSPARRLSFRIVRR